jgi:ribosomal protein S18 acetylase RimI-like enzyme
MAKTRIRPALDADFPLLLEIDAASFPDGNAYDASELSWYMNRAGTETLVLESDGTVAAFLIVETSRKQQSATIVTVDVRAEFRRRGFATALLDRTEAVLRKKAVERCRLPVDVGNTPAITFYEGRGFRKVRRLPRYYTNGADAWLMIKTLRPSGGR